MREVKKPSGLGRLKWCSTILLPRQWLLGVDGGRRPVLTQVHTGKCTPEPPTLVLRQSAVTWNYCSSGCIRKWRSTFPLQARPWLSATTEQAIRLGCAQKHGPPSKPTRCKWLGHCRKSGRLSPPSSADALLMQPISYVQTGFHVLGSVACSYPQKQR